jgi:hypothetical protein
MPKTRPKFDGIPDGLMGFASDLTAKLFAVPGVQDAMSIRNVEINALLDKLLAPVEGMPPNIAGPVETLSLMLTAAIATHILAEVLQDHDIDHHGLVASMMIGLATTQLCETVVN